MTNETNITDNSQPTILVACYKDVIYFAGTEITFPTHLNTLIAILGEPSLREFDQLWNVAWDDVGIYTSYGSWDNILDIKFLYSNHHQLEFPPKQFFKGRIMVEGLDIQFGDFDQMLLEKNAINQYTYEGETQPYCIAVGMNFEYKEEISADKYRIKKLTEEKLQFSDFGFKLSIIQELMYNKALLKPKFDLHEFVNWYDKRAIDLEEEGYEPIEEVTQYFRDLEIPKKLAPEITEILQDGGNDIYLNLVRFAEGWEEYWDIEQVGDAKQFPNLKTATLCYAKENVVDDFNALGIKADWL